MSLVEELRSEVLACIMPVSAKLHLNKTQSILSVASICGQHQFAELAQATIQSIPESSFCQIVSCRDINTVVASCPSSGIVVRATASYAKDMIFGSDAVNGRQRQVIKANGGRDEFCGYCGYDEALEFAPEVSACGQAANSYAVEKEDI